MAKKKEEKRAMKQNAGQVIDEDTNEDSNGDDEQGVCLISACSHGLHGYYLVIF